MCCHEKSGCLIQDNLKGKPEECSSAQIKECHGEKSHHPCVDFKNENE